MLAYFRSSNPHNFLEITHAAFLFNQTLQGVVKYYFFLPSLGALCSDCISDDIEESLSHSSNEATYNDVTVSSIARSKRSSRLSDVSVVPDT